MTLPLKIALGPLLLAQGIYVRRRAMRLPEPDGARDGTRGSGALLRLLVLGDSAAAGVGARTQDVALLGHLVDCFARDHTVRFSLNARTGAASDDVRATLLSRAAAPFDVVVTSLGVNDVTRGRSRAAFLADQAAIVSLLETKFRARHIVLTGLPPVHRFPLLPQPLRWYLGREAIRFDRGLEAMVAPSAACIYLRQPVDGDVTMMAEDGYHPGPAIYERWARLVEALVRPRLRLPQVPGL